MLQSELSLCISELYGGDDWNECFWLSAVINHEGWKSSSLLNCNAVNPDFAIGFCLHTASTDELSHMKQSQHNPNTNTSLNNSKFLRRFLFFFLLSDIPFAWSFSGEHRARLENFNMFLFSFFPSHLWQPGSNSNIISAHLVLSNIQVKKGFLGRIITNIYGATLLKHFS